MDNIRVFYDRRFSGVDLPVWWRDLRRLRSPEGNDGQLLWNAFESEWKRTDAYSHKTLREKLRVWNRFLSAQPTGPHGRAEEAQTHPTLPACFLDPDFDTLDPYLRFFAGLRWRDAASGLRIFSAMATYLAQCRDWRHARNMRTVQEVSVVAGYSPGVYVRPFFYLCVHLCDQQQTDLLMPTLESCTRLQLMQALATLDRERGRAIKAVYQITRGPWAPFLPAWSAWTPISKREVHHRPVRRMRQRDRFTDEEIAILRGVARQNPLDHGLFTFFLSRPVRRIGRSTHTGCRSGAACSLRVEHVADCILGEWVARPSGRVEEKGGTLREFSIDPVLADALVAAIGVNRGSPYVFPAAKGIGRRPEVSNDHWFHDLCHRAGIQGDHVHVHAIPSGLGCTESCLGRTTISVLLDLGLPPSNLSDRCRQFTHCGPALDRARYS